MRLLVTGAGGFVGRPLCRELAHRGYRVRAAMRTRGQLSADGETVTVGDVDAATKWADALKGVDTVMHLAARVHVMKDRSADPLTEYLKVNLYGTSNLAQQAASAGVKRLVYVSTVKVNGETTGKVNGEQTSEERPYIESDVPDPQDPYAVSKLQAEEVLHSISVETGLEVVIVRPPLVYGPGVKGNFLSLMRAVDRGWPLPFGAIENRRSLIYLGNLVNAVQASLAVPPGTYLPSDRDDVSTAALVRRVASALGRPARLFPVPVWLLRAFAKAAGRSAAMDRLCGSLTVDGHLPDWRPPFTMTQALAATAEWYRGAGPRG